MPKFHNRHAEFKGKRREVSEAYERWKGSWCAPSPAVWRCGEALKALASEIEHAERQQQASVEWVRAEMRAYAEKLRELRAREAALQLAEDKVWDDAIRDNSDIAPPASH